MVGDLRPDIQLGRDAERPMEQEDWVHLGAIAAIAGGLAWIVKGGLVLAVGVQPPLLFQLGFALFAVGMLGVSRRLESRGRT